LSRERTAGDYDFNYPPHQIFGKTSKQFGLPICKAPVDDEILTFDLARYFLPVVPVPTRWRRRMLAIGSGEPTKAICSTFLAQMFQEIGYPILPVLERRHWGDPSCNACYDEVLHIRHHSLFAPRDFDISPYFQVLKPALAGAFDYHRLAWAEPHSPFQTVP
jgi:hypothetical protein